MTMRVLSKRVTFIRPFVIVGLKGVQPSGTYSVEMRDERAGVWWFLRAKLTSTSIRVCRNPGVGGVLETVSIDAPSLADALLRDVVPAEVPRLTRIPVRDMLNGITESRRERRQRLRDVSSRKGSHSRTQPHGAF